MISRRTRAILLGVAAVAAVAAAIAVGCNKVPLLAPTGSHIVVSATATALPVNGSADIIAQVLESAGTPPQDGTLVTFTTSLGSVQPAQAETLGGRVTVKFNAGTTSGTATIIATSGGATPTSAGAAGAAGAAATSGSDTVKIAIGTAAVASVTLVANPGTLPSTGGNATVIATVADPGGNALGGVPVSFSTEAGSVSPTVVATDASGKAQATLTTSRTAKVTASAGLVSGSGSTAAATSGSTTVVVNATQAITIGTVTPAAPVVGQAVTAPLTYTTLTAGMSPIVRVSVNWGDGAVDSFTGQPGAVSHVYSAAGSYVAQVTGTDASGEKATTSASVTVTRIPKPVVGITADTGAVASGGTKFTFTVAASATAPDTIQNNHLDFGDNGAFVDLGSGTVASHIYLTASGNGARTATVTTTTANGATSTASVVIIVP